MMTSASPAHLATLADSTRGRLLLVLEHTELTVGELCAVLQLPQSTISRHLKILSEDAWVESRAEGTSRYYRMANLDTWTGRLWGLVREDLEASAAARQDQVRVAVVTADRRRRSREYFSGVAQQWDEVRAGLFGSRIDLHVALSLIEPTSSVGDLGCGSGHIAELLAPHVARGVAVDGSVEMADAARRRLAEYPNVDVRHGDLERLPVEDSTLDLAVLALVLHYVSEPEGVITEAHRVLRPGGRLVVIDMLPHDRDDLGATMGHLWSGFSESRMGLWFGGAGFTSARIRPLSPDPEAKGPELFLATGMRGMH